MQALHKHKQGMSTVAVARQVFRDHGVGGFFKGLMPSMVMVVNPTIQYIIYESLVARALDIRSVQFCQLAGWGSWVGGGGGGYHQL